MAVKQKDVMVASEAISYINTNIRDEAKKKITCDSSNVKSLCPSAPDSVTSHFRNKESLPTMKADSVVATGNFGKGNPINIANVRAKMQTMLKEWGYIHKVTIRHGTGKNSLKNAKPIEYDYKTVMDATMAYTDGVNFPRNGTQYNTYIQGIEQAAGGPGKGSLTQASTFQTYITNIYNKWWSIANDEDNIVNYDYTTCHTNCHSSCHGSGGRR